MFREVEVNLTLFLLLLSASKNTVYISNMINKMHLTKAFQNIHVGPTV